MPFKKVKKYRIYEEVLAQLEDYLLKGNVTPGNKLPSERELARMFDVNRVSVREALTVLEANGMITRKVGEGTFRTSSHGYTASSIIDAVRKNQHLIIEPLQVRRVLEPKIARLAATYISKEQAARLNDLLKQQRELLKTGGDIIGLDGKFHQEIAVSTGNSIFEGLVAALHKTFAESRFKSPMAPERGKDGYLSHRKIYDALRHHDPDKAEEAMLDHIIQVEQSAIKYLNDQAIAV